MKLRIRPALALLLVIVAVGISNYYFLIRDVITPIYDASICFLNSRHYYDNLIPQLCPERFFYSLFHNINFYPPLYMLVPLPFYILAEASADVMAMVNLLYLAILIYAVHKISDLVYGKPAGALSVIPLLFFPSVLGFTRLTHSTIAVTAVLSLSVYMLIKSDNFNQKRTSVLAGLLTGVGLLFNSEFWVYLTGPYFICLAQALPRYRQKGFLKEILINSLLFFVPVMLITGPYYYAASRFCLLDISNFKSYAPIWAIQHFDLNAFFHRVFEFLQVMRKQVLTCNLMLFIVSIIALKKQIFQPGNKIIFFGWFLITWLLISAWPAVESRFIVPILPSVAVLISGLAVKIFNSVKKRFPEKIAGLALVCACVYGGLNLSCFFKEHPYPKNSAELCSSRWAFGMLHIFSQSNPGQELVSYLHRHQNTDSQFKIIVVFANDADPAPLVLELIYGALFNSKLNIEIQSAMRLAVSAWHSGLSGAEKEKLIQTFFKQANYILYINNSIYQDTASRPEYKHSDNQLLQIMLVQEKDKKLVWEYQDKNKFFTETIHLFQKPGLDEL